MTHGSDLCVLIYLTAASPGYLIKGSKLKKIGTFIPIMPNDN
jgi:hypothetical protein